MAAIEDFCRALDLEEAAVRAALTGDSPGDTPAGEATRLWYVQGILGLGAWISGIILVTFGVTLIVLVFDLDDPIFAFLALGMSFFGAGFALLRRRRQGIFKRQFSVALAAAGIALAAGGAGVEIEEIWVIALISLPFAVLVAWKAPSRTLQALASAFTVLLAALALLENEVPFFLGVTALALAAGTLLLLRPPRLELRPTAVALLLCGPILSVFHDGVLGFRLWDEVDPGAWVARVIHVAVFVWLISLLWPQATTRPARVELAVFAATATALCLIMPPGGSGALVIMALAFVLGSRLLALLGSLLQIYFVWRFYYDLDLTLLDKSLMMMAAGLVMLALWGAILRATGREGDG